MGRSRFPLQGRDGENENSKIIKKMTTKSITKIMLWTLALAALVPWVSQAETVTVIRTFVNGVSPANSNQEVHALEIRTSKAIASVTPNPPNPAFATAKLKSGTTKAAIISFKQPLPTGKSVTVVLTSRSNKFGLRGWSWFDGKGKKVKRTITYVSKGKVKEGTVENYPLSMRGDEGISPEFPAPGKPPKRGSDVFSIINKRHHWGGAARLQKPITAALDIRKLVSKRPKGVDAEVLIGNVVQSAAMWELATRLDGHRRLPLAGLKGIPENHGGEKVVDPPLMAPGPTHRGVSGKRFRNLTDREAKAALIKYPQGLSLRVVTSDDDSILKDPRVGKIACKWGRPKGGALGIGPSKPFGGKRKDTTKSAKIIMRTKPPKSRTWHFATDTDDDGFLTNADSDPPEENAYDFYSIFSHELGHTLCFNHSGKNDFTDLPQFFEPSDVEFPGEGDDRCPCSREFGFLEDSDRHFVVFASDRAGGFGGFDLWIGIWDGTAWEVQNLGPDVNSAADESGPFLAGDGVTLLFHSNRSGGAGGLDLYEAKISESEDVFLVEEVENLLGLNSPADDKDAHLTADMRSLVFASDRDGGFGGSDIWAAEALFDEGFSAPYNLGSDINSPAVESGPALSSDGVFLFFASDRPGGQGGTDIWASLDSGGWSDAINLSSVNSPTDDLDPDFRADGQFLYFSSERGGAGSRIFEAPVAIQP